MQSTTILVAEDPRAMPILDIALDGYRLIRASTKEDALVLIDEHEVNIFVIGVHFDNFQSLELVSTIRKIEKHWRTPIIIVRCLPSVDQSLLRTTVGALVQAGTVSEYIEVVEDPDAVDKIRMVVEGSLA